MLPERGELTCQGLQRPQHLPDALDRSNVYLKALPRVRPNSIVGIIVRVQKAASPFVFEMYPCRFRNSEECAATLLLLFARLPKGLLLSQKLPRPVDEADDITRKNASFQLLHHDIMQGR